MIESKRRNTAQVNRMKRSSFIKPEPCKILNKKKDLETSSQGLKNSSSKRTTLDKDLIMETQNENSDDKNDSIDYDKRYPILTDNEGNIIHKKKRKKNVELKDA